MRKIVLNRCFGGFGLSPIALKRLAELQGRECYFYKTDNFNGPFILVPIEEASSAFVLHAFDIPNINDVYKRLDWPNASHEERQANNEIYKQHEINNMRDDRTNAFLIQVVEELGSKASGKYAELEVIEFSEEYYQIEEYDGTESLTASNCQIVSY